MNTLRWQAKVTAKKDVIKASVGRARLQTYELKGKSTRLLLHYTGDKITIDEILGKAINLNSSGT